MTSPTPVPLHTRVSINQIRVYAARSLSPHRGPAGGSSHSRPRADELSRVLGRVVLLEAPLAVLERGARQEPLVDGRHDGAAVVGGPPERVVVDAVVERRPAGRC